MKSIEIYTSSSGNTQIEVQFEKDTVWLSLNQISELFQRDKSVISRHLSKIFKEKELEKNSVVAKYATTAIDGKTYQVDYYNLDAILSVGYRVNSKQGTQFRIWASQRLKEYLLEGVSINKKRLKELEKIVNIIESIESTEYNQLSEAKGLLNILNNYTKSFILLSDYKLKYKNDKKRPIFKSTSRGNRGKTASLDDETSWKILARIHCTAR